MANWTHFPISLPSASRPPSVFYLDTWLYELVVHDEMKFPRI